jgi:hypothetical protein
LCLGLQLRDWVSFERHYAYNIAFKSGELVRVLS